MSDSSAIHGTVAPGFEPLADAFAATHRAEGGSALSVRVEGEVVADLWAGIADPHSGRAWDRDTPAVVFSCSKGVVAVLVGTLVEGGLIELDRPLAEYWPEFAARGKGSVTVRQVLAHRAGVPAFHADIDLATALDPQAIAETLADAEPLWEPGTAHSYHALTYGWLAGELIRRVTGRSVGQYLRDVADPLVADFWFGVPAEVETRIARLIAGESVLNPPFPMSPPPEGSGMYWIQRAMTLGSAFPADLVSRGRGFDDPLVHRAEVPGAGGIGTAAGLATLFSATVTETNGYRLLSSAVIDDMTRVQSEGPAYWPMPMPGPAPRWGTGFMLPWERRAFLGSRSFGHDGAGGGLAFADPERRVGFGYVTNLLEMDDDRGESIARRLRDLLD